MSTPRTLPSSDGCDDARSSVIGTDRPTSPWRRRDTIEAVRSSPSLDPVAGPVLGSTTPTSSDLTGLVIDLTDELERDRTVEEPRPASSATSTPETARSRPVEPSREMVRGELARTAAIHLSQLPDGFFVRFGHRFLAAYHGTFLAGPLAAALVVGPVGDPTGFVVGTLDNPRHYRWLVRNVGPLLRSGLVSLTVRPGLAHELLRTRARRYLRSVGRLIRRRWMPIPPLTDGPTHRMGTSSPVPVVAVLTHVAVAPDAQGTGLGRDLVEAFVACSRERGADEIRLIAHVDTPAPAFYRRLGWTSLGERSSSDGRLVEEFQLVL